MARLPPLNAIRAFEAAGRLSSITAAADELFVTPSAISQQIRALESHLKLKLFVRRHRAITLTPVGQQYLVEVSHHLAGLHRATAKLLEQRGRRVLRIQAHTTFAMRWLVPRLSSFHARHPRIDVRLTTSQQAPDFSESGVDGAIRLGNGRWPRVHADLLVPNRLTPVCQPQLLKRRRHLRVPEGLAGETLLHSIARPDDWLHWLQAAKVSGVDPYGGLKYESSVLAYQAAIEGQGVAIAQRVLVDDDVAAGRLVYLYDFTLDMGPHTYYFVYPKNATRSRELDTFRRWLVAARESAPS